LPNEKRGTLKRKPNPHQGKRAKARFRSRDPHLVLGPVSSNVVGYSGPTSRRSHLPHPSAYSPYFGLCPARTSGADSRAGYGSELKPQQHRPPGPPPNLVSSSFIGECLTNGLPDNRHTCSLLRLLGTESASIHCRVEADGLGIVRTPIQGVRFSSPT